jgi:hypothetical protein
MRVIGNDLYEVCFSRRMGWEGLGRGSVRRGVYLVSLGRLDFGYTVQYCTLPSV